MLKIGILSLLLSLNAKLWANSAADIALSDFASPVGTEARYILLGGIALTSFVYFNSHSYDKRVRSKNVYQPPFKEYGYLGEVIGWGYLNGLYTFGMGVHGLWTKRKKSLQRMEIMGSSSLFSLLSVSVMKLSINRTRPNYEEKHDSFPSGHAAMAFNFATVITAEHGIWWGGAAFGLAGFIAYSRVNDGWHWLSDIIAGATIGASYGWGVYLNRRKNKGGEKFWFSLYPNQSSPIPGVQVSYFF